MPLPDTLPFQIHWSLVPSGDAGDLATPGCRLLAIWPAPVNHDACFAAAGFTLFGDNDAAWHRAAEDLLGRVICQLSLVAAPRLVSASHKEDPPWYLRPFRTGRDLPLLQQALWPMLEDSLPWFQAQFGEDGTTLRTGGGHFLLWVALSDAGPAPAQFIARAAAPWPIVETRLRWRNLVPDASARETGAFPA